MITPGLIVMNETVTSIQIIHSVLGWLSAYEAIFVCYFTLQNVKKMAITFLVLQNNNIAVILIKVAPKGFCLMLTRVRVMFLYKIFDVWCFRSAISLKITKS